ncbi:hypothetical protein DSO57_1024323 [Entomophthora muscae]|uniref:Uncharacterized protein n=1 Tax=Entomophthora muscae TaxID=34485 RepID=A0ACC2U0G9_9FUNG|nr:hypothetical protein DSO57_1024323 [Entomophthora muscae]
MSGLPVDRTPYTPGTEIPEGYIRYQKMVMLVPSFNALSAQGVMIDNSFTLETWAQGWDLNTDPESLRATCLCFPEVKPPQAEAKNDGPNGKVNQTKRNQCNKWRSSQGA